MSTVMLSHLITICASICTQLYNTICLLLSDSNKRGRFSMDGIAQGITTNSTFVQCTSTHLTSFAVLVDTSGGSVSSII